MVPREGTRWLRLPEYTGACPYEVVVEEPLVVAPLPAAPVEGFQRVPATLHPVEAAAGLAAGQAVEEGLERVPGSGEVGGGRVAGALDGVVGAEDVGVVESVPCCAVHGRDLSLSWISFILKKMRRSEVYKQKKM